MRPGGPHGGQARPVLQPGLVLLGSALGATVWVDPARQLGLRLSILLGWIATGVSSPQEDPAGLCRWEEGVSPARQWGIHHSLLGGTHSYLGIRGSHVLPSRTPQPLGPALIRAGAADRSPSAPQDPAPQSLPAVPLLPPTTAQDKRTQGPPHSGPLGGHRGARGRSRLPLPSWEPQSLLGGKAGGGGGAGEEEEDVYRNQSLLEAPGQE